MRAGQGTRKVLLLIHILTSVGMMGAVSCFFALACIGLVDTGAGIVVYPAMNIITEALIVPLALASLVVGTLQALVTQWGLVRHYWVLLKLVLTTIVVVILFMQTPNIAVLGSLPADALDGSEWATTRFSMVIHAGGGFVVLALTLILSVYKPKGFTPYGWRRRASS